MNPFETIIRSKVESAVEQKQDTLQVLIEQFPEELQERWWTEIEEMDTQTAEDFLVMRLVARKESLIEWRANALTSFVEVSHEMPLGIRASIERSQTEGHSNVLGEGKNGKVYESIRRPYACYKVLFIERAKTLHLNIVREAMMQHDMQEALKGEVDVASIPDVLGFVDHTDVRAIMMDRINGVSMLDVFNGKASLPAGFNLKDFFRKLENTITILNERGYFHRDLTDNAGNVMIDEEGNPWIVDFGSAVKSINPNGGTNSYQLKAGGDYILANDYSGIQNLRKRVREYLNKQEQKV